jgi:hypothetical protein
MSQICGDTVGIRPRGFPVSYWLETRREMHPLDLTFVWAFPKVSTLLFKHCWKVSNSIWAFPKELPISFRFCSNGLQENLGIFPNVSWHKFGHFLCISLEAACFCFCLSYFQPIQPNYLQPNSNWWDSPFNGRQRAFIFRSGQRCWAWCVLRIQG